MGLEGGRKNSGVVLAEPAELCALSVLVGGKLGSQAPKTVHDRRIGCESFSDTAGEFL